MLVVTAEAVESYTDKLVDVPCKISSTCSRSVDICDKTMTSDCVFFSCLNHMELQSTSPEACQSPKGKNHVEERLTLTASSERSGLLPVNSMIRKIFLSHMHQSDYHVQKPVPK